MNAIAVSEKYTDEWLILEGVKTFCEGFLKGLELPPRLSISQWADTYRKLSSESSAEPGDWDTARAEYQRGMMDAISDINCSEITIEASAQVGKTEVLNNAIGYFIDKDPCPILLLQPNLEVAKSWSNDRLMPMIRDTPCLQGKIAENKDSGNTVFHKSFSGGHITIAGANSAASLASRPIRIVLMDEIDRYPISAGKEGDPTKLAAKRTTTFWNKKIIRCSTPTIAGQSRIHEAFLKSDMRFFFVPCPHCGQEQKLEWKNVKWENGDPQTAVYACPYCGSCWNDVERWHAVSCGAWRATKPFHGHAGFFIWEGYSPWAKLCDIVQNFKEAKEDPEQLKTFVNTTLAEPWEDKGERVDENRLLERREHYTSAPPEVVVITAGVDVQDDRLEVDRIGWTVNNQSFALGKVVLLGDPNAPRVWEELDELLQTPLAHDITGEMGISACCIDSGYLTQEVGKFCRERWNRRVWAIKGMPGEGRPILKRAPGKIKKLNLEFFLVGVDTVKDVIYSRLKLDDPGAPGYCHFNMSYDEAHFLQLTAEEAKVSYVKGRKIRFYALRPGRKRNEALDIFGYALAALEGLKLSGLNLRKRWEKMLAAHADKAQELMIKNSETQMPGEKNKSVRMKSRRRVVGRFS